MLRKHFNQSVVIDLKIQSEFTLYREEKQLRRLQNRLRIDLRCVNQA